MKKFVPIALLLIITVISLNPSASSLYLGEKIQDFFKNFITAFQPLKSIFEKVIELFGWLADKVKKLIDIFV